MVLEAKRIGIAFILAVFVAALPVTVSFAYSYPQQNYQLYECYDYSYGSYYSYSPCPVYQPPVYQPPVYQPPVYYYDYWYYEEPTYYYYEPQTYYYDYYYDNSYSYAYWNNSNVNINNGGYYGGWYY